MHKPPSPPSAPHPPKHDKTHMQKRKKRKIIIWSVATVIFAAIFLNPGCLSHYAYEYALYKAQLKLVKPETFMFAGETMALYCQSYQSLVSLLGTYGCEEVLLVREWIPKEFDPIDRLPTATICKQKATVRFGSGFYHYGYKLEFDAQSSTSIMNVWHLYSFHGDRSDGKFLTSLHMDATRQLSPDEIKPTRP